MRRYLYGFSPSTLLRKCMTKPRIPRPVTTRKAPKAAKPARLLKGFTRTLSLLLGARISRRAADRLRGGYLWVYASDIEAIELPDAATLPRCCRWPTAADCCWARRFTALPRRLRCGWSPREASMRPLGWSCWPRGCARRLPGANLCSTSGTTPAGCVSARPTSCPAWWRTSTATW